MTKSLFFFSPFSNWYSTMERYACAICSKTFSHKRTLNQHVRTHEQVWTCSTCQATFTAEKSLKRHVKNQHPIQSDIKKWTCSICSKTFSHQTNLTRHIKKNMSLRKEQMRILTTSPGKRNVEKPENRSIMSWTILTTLKKKLKKKKKS